jgi:peptidyl-prolyl cis-trans isomerase D
MGGMFSSGNTNNIAKVNEKNISSEEFIDYLNNSGVPQEYIRENLDKEIIQELLAGLISSTLLDLEIEKLNISISKDTLLKQIKTNKNFLDENGNFQRIKYEKFLLENNQSAAGFELRLKKREEQKNLFDYIGAGTVSPRFLVKRLYEEENKKLDIEFIDLNNFYSKKENISDQDMEKFIRENQEQLKIDYLDFSYAKITPQNLLGLDEFNQAFFDKIDQIEIDISNEVNFNSIVDKLKIKSTNIKNFKFSESKDQIEKKIFELKNNTFDIFENENEYILYKIDKSEQRTPDLTDTEIKNEITELIHQKNKFDYNKDLIDQITNKSFTNEKFLKMSQNNISAITLNSVRDNKKFEINAVKLLYSLPEKSFTLINDEQNNIYLAKVKKFEKVSFTDDNYNDNLGKQNSNARQSILKSYDIFLNDKYEVTLNQKTIQRVKNFYQ